MITVLALYDLYIEEFFAVNPHLKGRCVDMAVLVIIAAFTGTNRR